MRHPNNYYAWQYLRKYLELVQSPPSGPSSRPSTSSLFRFGDVVFDWCKDHPSDVSGWMFLYYLCLLPMIDEEHRYRYVSDAVDFVRKYRWKGEAVWTFISLTIAKSETSNLDCERDILASLEQDLQNFAGSPKATYSEAYVYQLRKAVGAARCIATRPL